MEATAKNQDPQSDPESVESIETQLLLEGIYRRYGFDFRDYAKASLQRRISSRLQAEGLRSISGLQEKILHDARSMEALLEALTIHTTSMFRDPGFTVVLRERVLPELQTYPFIRIWDAGCSTGEEVYSLAILLKEEGVYDRCRIYATDMSEEVLRKAKAAIFPLSSMKEFTQNYLEAGGKRSFSDYYTASHDNAVFHPSLKENIVFSEHNLATDQSFNEFNLILCRNVMIYFNRSLQDRVLALLYSSLSSFGFLCLGNKESLKFSPQEAFYEAIDGKEKIYRRIK